MKSINSFNILNKTIESTAQSIECFIQGDIGSYCHLHIFDNSSPTKFYNFKTKSFVNGFES